MKITTKLVDSICQCIRDKRPAAVCAQQQGVSKTTHNKWCSEGAKPDASADHQYYSSQVYAAMADAEIEVIDTIASHGKGDWRAADRLLTILNPEEYVTDVKIKMSGRVEQDVIHRVELPTEDIKLLLDSLREFVDMPIIDGKSYEHVLDAEVVEDIVNVVELEA